MKHETAKLEGCALDYAVALAENKTVTFGKFCTGATMLLVDNGIPWYPSGLGGWSQGGPIIERERIWLTAFQADKWSADIPGEPGDPLKPPPTGAYGVPGHCKGTGAGPTLLVAAMRAYVHARLGAEVELPETAAVNKSPT